MRNVIVIAAFALACAPDLGSSDAGYAAYTSDGGTLALSCVPNLNGRIDASQMQPALGATANFLVSPQGRTRSVDLLGTIDGMGHQLWDWSVPDPSDQVASIAASSLEGKWYAASFPTGQFVVPIDAADTLEGVYRTTDSAVELFGIASTQPNPVGGKTLLVYQSPVALYQFPIEPGRSWTVSGTSINATLKGLPYAGVDTYEVSVDASGILALPDLTFTQVMRVRLKTTVMPAAGETVFTREVSFFAQCFGEVARATSLPNETNANFTTAAELRRLGLSGD